MKYLKEFFDQTQKKSNLNYGLLPGDLDYFTEVEPREFNQTVNRIKSDDFSQVVPVEVDSPYRPFTDQEILELAIFLKKRGNYRSWHSTYEGDDWYVVDILHEVTPGRYGTYFTMVKLKDGTVWILLRKNSASIYRQKNRYFMCNDFSGVFMLLRRILTWK